MNIILLFVNHAVFTMFQFLCLDNGNNVAARRVGNFDVSMTTNIIIIIIMAEMAGFFYVAGYLIEERRRWPVITASPRGQCSK